MPKVNVYNMLGEQTGEIELAEDVFGVEINQHVLYEVVKNQLANRRQGTQSVKTRSEVRGGGRKPWRQKGTGRARHGSIRSPLWVGGGVAFAPKPRDYSYKVPRKVKRLAIKSALSSKVLSDELIVLDELIMEEPKTKEMAEVLANIKAGKKALIVMNDNDINVIKSARNIPNIQTIFIDNLNVYDILNSDTLIITKEGIRKVEEVFA